MATLDARDSAVAPGVVVIAEAQAGNGASTHIADRGPSHKVGGTMVRVIPAPGATPTCTYAIEVSSDGTNWAAATYADIATPNTDVATTFVLTTAVIARKILKHPTMWRYIRVTMSANTNVTNTIDVWFNDRKDFIP
jgi:hypothetical protein